MNKIFKIVVYLFISILFFFHAVHSSTDDGLVMYLSFDGNADDTSGNENNGVAHGATLAPDRHNNPYSCYYFDGINDYIQIPNKQELNPDSNNMTWSFWIKGNGYYAMGKTSDYKMNGYLIRFSSSKIYFYGRDTTMLYYCPDQPSENNEVCSHNLPEEDEWFFVTIVLDRTTNSLNFFVNSTLIGQDDISDVGVITNSSNIMIGTGYDSTAAAGYFEGFIDEVRIYNRSLSEAEIQTLYYCGSTCCNINQINQIREEGRQQGIQECFNDPQSCNIQSGQYTVEDMQNMVNQILLWDINKDKKINLIEAINIIMDSAGVKSTQK